MPTRTSRTSAPTFSQAAAKAAESVVAQQRALQQELAEKAARLNHLKGMLT
jgi:hypothetical protein